ncbi:MAG TPA: pitrilysin family protein [Polyangiaceae bacterium]|nr:pitrilysin family protein [Polyangiaceae bacterium]
MRFRLLGSIALLLASSVARSGLSGEPAPNKTLAAKPPPVPSVPFEKYSLDNGFTVILHRDPTLPLCAINLWYHVGPANEPPGRSGFAHLFEHLMFEGSRHVGRQFDWLLESVGATNVNGTTSWDRTNYFETVPREHLELVLWIESDRMATMLDGLDQERLDVQRDVVKNERRQSYENSPYGPSSLALSNALFPKGHPYNGAIIGSMADLSAATLDDVKQFFRTYYVPSNATLAIAGDFESDEAKRLIKKYFGTLSSAPKPPRPNRTTPPLSAPQRLVIDEPVTLARVSMGWITPPAYTPDDSLLDVVTLILAGGKSSRLYRKLVVEQQIAADVDASLDSNALASHEVVSATAASGKSVEELERSVSAVIAELATQGPTPFELARAKRRIQVETLGNLELLNGPGGESGRAGLLQRFDHYLGDPGYLPKYLAQVSAVGAEDVKRAAREFLKPEARVVVVTRPTQAPAKKDAAAPGAAKARP